MRLICLVSVVGCAREPAEAICPEVAVGELVVTEVRGPQSPADAAGPWIEVFNASGRGLELEGMRIDLVDVQRQTEARVLVRRSLTAAAGAYVVFGMFEDGEPPPHVDYGFAGDFGAWKNDLSVLEVSACGALVDRVRDVAPPNRGTYSLKGTPEAGRNDLAAAWCFDQTQVGSAYPGTPQNPNVACP